MENVFPQHDDISRVYYKPYLNDRDVDIVNVKGSCFLLLNQKVWHFSESFDRHNKY